MPQVDRESLSASILTKNEGANIMRKGIGHACKVLVAAFLGVCASVPEGLHPVADFQVGRYLGTWYEISRLDHSFERGLESAVRDDLLAKAKQWGFRVEDLIFVEQ